jgi:hypothetical protein
VTGNDASGQGGGIFLDYYQIDGNTASACGAVLNQGHLTVWGCTLAFNVATLGAAIDNEGLLTAYNSPDQGFSASQSGRPTSTNAAQ